MNIEHYTLIILNSAIYCQPLRCAWGQQSGESSIGAPKIILRTPYTDVHELLSINQSIHVYFRHMVHSYTTTQ